MPQMGESIAEGTLSKWLKKGGDEVKRDEPIFEISTDKVDAEIPSPSAGVLAEIIVKEGETVAVQTVVARLETEKGATAGSGTRDAGSAGVAASTGSIGIPTPLPASPNTPALSASPPARQQPDTPATAAPHAGNANPCRAPGKTKSS